MDRQQNNESSADSVYRNEASSKFNYFQFLNNTNLQSNQKSSEDDKPATVLPKSPESPVESKSDNGSEAGNIDGLKEETPRDLNKPIKDEDIEGRDEPKKRTTVFKKIFKSLTANETDNVEIDGFIWLKDDQKLKQKLRRHFLKPPEEDKANIDESIEKSKENAIRHGFIDLIAGSVGNQLISVVITRY